MVTLGFHAEYELDGIKSKVRGWPKLVEGFMRGAEDFLCIFEVRDELSFFSKVAIKN